MQVGGLRLVELQRASERVEHACRWVRAAALLEADVVVDADPGALRELLAAQARDASTLGAGQTSGGGREGGAPGAQEGSEIRFHGNAFM